MDPLSAGIVGGVLGMLTVVVAVVLVRRSDRRRRRPPIGQPTPAPALPQGIADVLAVLRSSGIVLDAADQVLQASSSAVSLGLVRDGELVHRELRALARQVRRDGVIREDEMELARGPLGAGTRPVRARVAPIGPGFVLLLTEDRTQERRIEEVRRDFVVNVSHELKTPVGGLALLAEAMRDANDDPEAVARFADRMKRETSRLTRLVTEIVELSRLQAGGTLTDPVPVDVAACAREAAEHAGLLARGRDIVVTAAAAPQETVVYGDAELLTTAIVNLVTNAINYSEDGTRVSVAVARRNDLVEVAVTDQGQGIPAHEQERIFERFYRVDPARSRVTGGTGLGLSIVKHVCADHGGEVTVWSRPGGGSTFTMLLPPASRHAAPATDPTPREVRT